MSAAHGRHPARAVPAEADDHLVPSLELVVAGTRRAAPDVAADAPFRLRPDDRGGWVLSGEVDFTSASALESALGATISSMWVVDVAALEFVDVAGMRAIARSSAASPVPLELRRVSEQLRRLWRLAGFDRLAPRVRLQD